MKLGNQRLYKRTSIIQFPVVSIAQCLSSVLISLAIFTSHFVSNYLKIKVRLDVYDIAPRGLGAHLCHISP